ncbi:MAG: nitrilase-related carbon-nitrogen hydrolase [Candidatus Eisenbacteria bacterium]
MRVAVVQMRPEFGDVARNRERAESMVASEKADLYVLPELCLSGYLFESREEAVALAHAPDDGVFDGLAALSRSAGAAIVVGFAEIAGASLFNSSVLLAPDGSRAVYRKIQLFWGEKLIFEPGDRPPAVVEAAGARLGMMICFDWIFPEVARSLALGGAQILCHSANLVLPYCQAALVTRCIENRVFAACANRVGTETRAGKTLTFTGMSEIVAPNGEILARGSVDGEDVLVAEVDPTLADDKAVTPENDILGDRRTELYRL